MWFLIAEHGPGSAARASDLVDKLISRLSAGVSLTPDSTHALNIRKTLRTRGENIGVWDDQGNKQYKLGG
jgi:hypothetical protein